jgi:hypothetical protein
MTKVCSQLPPFIFNMIVSILFVNFKGGKFEFQKLKIIDQGNEVREVGRGK